MTENRSLSPLACVLPARIPVLPVRSTVVFPMGATALQIAFPPNVEALYAHDEKDLLVAIVSTAEDHSPIDPTSLQKIAVAARVLDRLNLPGGSIQVTIRGLTRVHLTDVVYEKNYYTATPIQADEIPATEAEAERLIELILTLVSGVSAKVERINDEVPRILSLNVNDPGRFADLTATLCQFHVPDRDEVLQRLDVTERLDFVLGRLQESWERLQEIEAEHRQATAAAPTTETAVPAAAPAVATSRRDRVGQVRKQIRALQAELGEIDPAERESLEMLRRINRAQLPTRVAAIARREAERLRVLPSGGTETVEIRTYLEALLSIPWSRTTERERVDLQRVREILDEEHLGLEETKDRIVEILSVAQLRQGPQRLIPCIVGPPGVGKRTLATTIAKALNRPMVRLDLGGRGESQLIGTRRTRSGAQPGKMVTALRDADVKDPVYLLEEVDEVGLGNVEGDPVEALEELLDPDVRTDFIDRYLDVPIDLSQVFFIATANDFYRIPRSIRDYFIEIRIAGYTPEEKVEIARTRLLADLAEEHGLDPDDVELPEEAALFLTRGYARDAGLGSLRRALAAIMRYFARAKATGEGSRWVLDADLIEKVLGTPRYTTTVAESAPEVGVVTGLAWTASGGEIMFIEALKMPGTGRLIITGLLGDVMRESVNAAYSYVRSRAAELGIPASTFPDSDVHVHFPVGAIPKDGPSAGAAVTLAIASSLADRPVRHDLSMTGEVTLRGRILEIGGVKEKTLAAYRAGLRNVILPRGNEKDLRDVPGDVREGMEFHFVERMEEVFDLALLEKNARRERRRSIGARAGIESGSRAAAEADGSE